MKKGLIGLVREALGPDYDVDKHFTPKYNPWDQRLCLIPNGDLFASIKNGKTEIVTDSIDEFTATGIKLKSGEELTADIIVTATGLNMQVMGGTEFFIDGRAVNFANTVTYKGHDVRGDPQSHSNFWLHQRFVDPARRPDRRVRLPCAQSHGSSGR